MEKVIENLMNELAGIWIDSLGAGLTKQQQKRASAEQKKLIASDFKTMCPGVCWIWEGTKIKVIDLKE